MNAVIRLFTRVIEYYPLGFVATYFTMLPANLVTMRGKRKRASDSSLDLFVHASVKSMYFAAMWPVIPWFILYLGNNPFVFDPSDL